jgi:hypothetical protein
MDIENVKRILIDLPPSYAQGVSWNLAVTMLAVTMLANGPWKW